MESVNLVVVWVKYGSGQAVQVSVPSDCDVNDLKEAIKLELFMALKDYDASQIDLVEDVKEGAEEVVYRSGEQVSAIVSGKSDLNPIHIRTTGNIIMESML